MVNNCYYVLMAGLLLGCQKQSENKPVVNHLKTELQLPVYITPNTKNNKPTLVQATGWSGQLLIVNGCVGLNYSESTQKFRTIIIFPNETKFVENGTGIKLANKVFYHGDFVLGAGAKTNRIFRSPLLVGEQPVAAHCQADEYRFSDYSLGIDRSKMK